MKTIIRGKYEVGYLYVLEVKHVSLHKGLFDFLVCPRDEQFIVVVSL